MKPIIISSGPNWLPHQKDVLSRLNQPPAAPVVAVVGPGSVFNATMAKSLEQKAQLHSAGAAIGRRKMINMKLSEYLGGMRRATTAAELESAIQVPYKHAFHGRTWSTISRVRIEVGNAICAAHPHGKFVPHMIGNKLSVIGEAYGVGRGGNSTGVRYAWHSAGEFAKSVLKRNGFSTRAASRIWDSWRDYPHRCLTVVEAALAGEYADPIMNTLIFSYTGTGPVKITSEQNDADEIDKRATLPCKCGGTLFDWGCGYSDDFTFVNWHCNHCADVFTEYVTPERFSTIRQPRLLLAA